MAGCRWATGAVLVCLLVLSAVPARGEDEEPDLEFMYPLVTRRPVIEREVELQATHARSRDGRETELSLALEIPILPRWLVELRVPLAIQDPAAGPTQTGIGDIEIETKVLLHKSVEHRLLVAAGLEGTLPTGSERRGLGGEAAIEPFVTAAIALGPVDLLAEVAYEFDVRDHVDGPREQEFQTSAAAGYRINRFFTPLLEATLRYRARGEDEEGERLLRRPELVLTPGFNAILAPGVTFRAGVEVPVTRARQFDYRVNSGIVFEF